MLKVQIKGKLYLIGEYNVINPNHYAVLIPSNKTFDVSIKRSSKYLFTEDEKSFDYFIKNNEVVDFPLEKEFSLAAIKTSIEYLSLKNIKVLPFEIIIDNNLKAKEKYGLGSSSAIFVGIIKAILLLHNIRVDSLTLFKLAMYAQNQTSVISSGGDIALCAFQKAILYKNFDHQIINNHSLFDVLNISWNTLEIQELPKINLFVYVVFSGTSHYKNDNIFINNDKPNVDDIYLKMNDLVLELFDCYLNENTKCVTSMINEYQEMLNLLSDQTHLNFMTNNLKDLLSKTRNFISSAKISGAGFGDCIIAVSNKDNLELIYENEKYEVIDVIKI